jgi:hypothetical protein
VSGEFSTGAGSHSVRPTRVPIRLPLTNKANEVPRDMLGNMVGLIVWADEFVEAMNIVFAIGDDTINLPADVRARVDALLNKVEGK